MFNTIVFDLDDTLIDSAATVINGFNYALDPFGIRITQKDIERMRSMTGKELFLDVLTASEAKKALARLWEYAQHSAGETVLINGVAELLETISKTNVNIGLWTGRDTASAVNILKTHQIHHYFKEIVGACSVENNKPHAEGLLLLTKNLKIRPNSIMHIGDHEHDLIGATSAGAIAIHAKWYKTDEIKENHPLAKFTFHTVEDFKLWIQDAIKK